MNPQLFDQLDIIAIERAARAERARVIGGFLRAGFRWIGARLAAATLPARTV